MPREHGVRSRRVPGGLAGVGRGGRENSVGQRKVTVATGRPVVRSRAVSVSWKDVVAHRNTSTTHTRTSAATINGPRGFVRMRTASIGLLAGSAPDRSSLLIDKKFLESAPSGRIRRLPADST